jgi:DNA invertase Pin-like site-specific DNA recombinase
MKRRPIAKPVQLPPGRTHVYGRGSTAKQVMTIEVQKTTMSDFAARLGRTVDFWWMDPATHSDKGISERPAGGKLMAELRRGDHLIVAKLDRLSRSFLEFAVTLDSLEKRGVVLHVCDIPGGTFDPTNHISRLMIHILVSFGEFERSLIRTRTREALQTRRLRGEKYCRWAEYGWRWEKRFDPRLNKHVNVRVPDENERVILRKVVELRAAGQSLDQIRQHLSYVMKVRTRMGGEWTTGRITFLFEQGLRLMAETAAATTDDPLALVDNEEEYDGLIHLEDESND